MSESPKAGLSAAVATWILVACAVAVTGMSVRQQFFAVAPTSAEQKRFSAQDDWESYVTGGNRLGNPDAKIVLVEFADFQCPACRALDGMFRKSHARFPEFAMLYRHCPLPNHRFAYHAAMASECAADQGRFESMHHKMFENIRLLGTLSWSALADSAGIPDIPGFDKCMSDSVAVAARVDRDFAEARRLNATGTPTVLINGVKFTGTLHQERLDSLIESALQAKR